MEIDERKLHPIDFEYNHKDNKFIHLVCVAIDNQAFWLNDGSELEDFKKYMESIKGEMLVSHASSLAEIPSCLIAGINVDDYLWYDTFITEKRLDHFFRKMDRSYSLLETLEKYGIKHNVGLDQKEYLRGVIIDGTNVEYKRMDILDYCKSDIEDLKELALAQINKLEEQISKHNYIDSYSLCPNCYNVDTLIGRFIERQSICNITTAKMYTEPFDADLVKINQLSDPRFVDLMKENINALIPGVYDEFGTFKPKVLRDFICSEDSGAYDWFKFRGYVTPQTGEISLKDDYLNEYLSDHKGFSDKLDTYRQIAKVIKASQGFRAEGEKNWIKPNLFEDGLHCNASEFGTVTTRYTPKPSKGWIPGMGKALRGLLKPNKKDEAYFSLDFNAQEIWVIGQLSKDVELLKTYSSNDIYMSVAQNMGLYPKDLKIPTEAERSEDWFKPYKPLRQKVKSLVLGLNYGMGVKSLAGRIKISEVEAEELVTKYKIAYKLKEFWTNDIVNSYDNHYSILLSNDVCLKHYDYKQNKQRNERQAMNYPVQGIGATITREALRLAFERGLKPIFPVHDEIYFKCNISEVDEQIKIARSCMIEAAFNAIGNANKDYPIKVGEAEVTTWNKVPQHSGGEATAELIDRNLLKLRTLPDNYKPFKTKKKNKVEGKIKDTEKGKVEQMKIELEGFYA